MCVIHKYMYSSAALNINYVFCFSVRHLLSLFMTDVIHLLIPKGGIHSKAFVLVLYNVYRQIYIMYHDNWHSWEDDKSEKCNINKERQAFSSEQTFHAEGRGIDMSNVLTKVHLT